ncbi:hypothetical protein D3C75_884550 [compost metagenome]
MSGSAFGYQLLARILELIPGLRTFRITNATQQIRAVEHGPGFNIERNSYRLVLIFGRLNSSVEKVFRFHAWVFIDIRCHILQRTGSRKFRNPGCTHLNYVRTVLGSYGSQQFVMCIIPRNSLNFHFDAGIFFFIHLGNRCHGVRSTHEPNL